MRADSVQTFDSYPSGMLDQALVLVGTARNAHSGAMVLLSDRTSVFIDGLWEWDEAWDRKSVQVTGTLRYKKLGPDPEVGPEGEQSHGMEGSSLVLEGASWVEAS